MYVWSLLFLTVAITAVSAQAPPWVGTWQLDVTQSSFVPGPAPYVRGTRRIELSEAGLTIVEEFVHPRGGVTHLEWRGALDGRDYRVHGVDLYVTYAYRAVDEQLLEGIVKVDGAVTSTSRATVSADLETLTVETIGQDARQGPRTTMVYKRISRP